MLLNSRPASPLPDDHDKQLEDFIQTLIPEREAVASELDVLRSIYGDRSIRIWTPSGSIESSSRDSSSRSKLDNTPLRYEIDTNLPSYEDVHIQILVSLPPTYPESSPPQLQLLSRYIGPFGVDSGLFGDVIKTYISSQSNIEFIPDSVAVFDGLQHVIERCNTWYEERLNEEAVGELIREEERSQRHTEIPQRDGPTAVKEEKIPIVQKVSIPELIEAEPIVDRKSVFVGRACRISHPSQVQDVLSYLLSDRRIARAAHPIINAWRCTVNGVLHQDFEDNDDDGETAAGGRLAHLLQILDLDGVLVIVTRFFGGIHLGPDRFKHINQAARLALEKGHFLDGVESQGRKRNVKKR